MTDIDKIKKEINDINHQLTNENITDFQRMNLYDSLGRRKEKLALMFVNGISIDVLEAVCSAVKEKRFKILPCKEDDLIWRLGITEDGKYYSTQVKFDIYMLNDHGHSNFLTKEECDTVAKGLNDR